MRYRPLSDEACRARPTTRRSSRTRSSPPPRIWREGPGDILVFLPGEREIRETAELLRRSLQRRPYAAAVEILPLFARLSVAEQQRVFAPSRGRRVVLATNVAETSLTVPGHPLRDRHRARARQALLAAQQDDAAADREDLAGRRQPARRPLRPRRRRHLRPPVRRGGLRRRGPRFTDPEILRIVAGGGDPADGRAGPRPTSRRFRSSSRRRRARSPTATSCCTSSAPSTTTRRLTALGRDLARLPRRSAASGRMMLARATSAAACAEVLVIASALSVPGPARPAAREAAGGRPGAPALPRRALGLPVAAGPLGVLRRQARRQKLTHRQLVERLPRRSSSPACACGEWRDVHGQLATRDDRARLEMVGGAAACDRSGALRGDPPGTARGAPRQHRPAGRGRRGLPRRPRHPLPPAPGLRARQEGRAMGARRRAGRDLAPLRPLRREGRAGVDRGGRRRPRHARPLRAALGQRPRRGRRQRARAALRAHAGAAPARLVRPHRSAARATGVPARGARHRRPGHARRGSSSTTGG